MCTDRVHPQVSQEVPYHSREGRYATVRIGLLGAVMASGAEPPLRISTSAHEAAEAFHRRVPLRDRAVPLSFAG